MAKRIEFWLLTMLAIGATPVRGAALPEPSTGILYDRVAPLSGIERFSGQVGGPAVRSATWWQIYDELRRASTTPTQPDPLTLRARATDRVRSGVVPLAVLDYRYQQGLVEARAFAVAVLQEGTWRGGDLTFVLDPSFVFGNVSGPRSLEIDFDDGVGFRAVRVDQPVRVRYVATGEKSLRVRATHADGTVLEARAAFTVRALVAPSPHDTLHVTASIAYQGQFGTGDAYIYLAPGHAALMNPIVVVEGFDIDNSYNWDELYELLNQQNLIEDLRAAGYDPVVLNFTEATDYLQKNAFVVTALLQQVEAAIQPQTSVAVVGASMGGLVARYALAWLETQGGGHRVRTFISFDTPHAGANIPLGIQYWVSFFAPYSADASFLLSRLNQPGARQMLVYHYTDPPTASGQGDPLRAGFEADLAAVGFPALPRTVAISNGSGAMLGQGFAPGDQIVLYDYNPGSNFLSYRGNVWAVPQQTSHEIFNGRIRVFFTGPTQSVTVSGTQPFDSAPGGSRATMAQMDSTAPPSGDIIALHASHCFIPTISALALDTSNLFYDVAGDPNLLAHTPFDAVYFPAANQEHVTITPENAVWLKSEIEAGVTGVDPLLGPEKVWLAPAAPNPSQGSVRLRFTLPREADVDLRIFAIDGREVARLATGLRIAGDHEVLWRSDEAEGKGVGAGVYFARLVVGDRMETRRFVVLD